jgi:hypothetical protein
LLPLGQQISASSIRCCYKSPDKDRAPFKGRDRDRDRKRES